MRIMGSNHYGQSFTANNAGTVRKLVRLNENKVEHKVTQQALGGFKVEGKQYIVEKFIKDSGAKEIK